MKILYLHQYYRDPAQGGAVRSWQVARALVKRGHHVVVITAWEGPVRKVVREPGLTVVHLPIAYRNDMSRRDRIGAFRRYVADAYTCAREHLPVDRLFVTSTPLTVGLVALALRYRFGVRYVFEVRDLWPEAPIQLGQVKGRIYRWALRALERRIYRSASGLVALSPPIADHLRAHAPRVPGLMVPNLADYEFFAPGRDESAEGPPTTRDAPITIAYTGTLGYANAPERVLSLIETADGPGYTGPQVRFVIAGEGAYLAAIKEKAMEKGWLDRGLVEIRGMLPRAGVRDLLHEADYAWVGFRPEPVLATGSPNKFFDALAAGTPILLDMPTGWLTEWLDANPYAGREVTGRSPVDILTGLLPKNTSEQAKGPTPEGRPFEALKALDQLAAFIEAPAMAALPPDRPS